MVPASTAFALLRVCLLRKKQQSKSHAKSEVWNDSSKTRKSFPYQMMQLLNSHKGKKSWPSCEDSSQWLEPEYRVQLACQPWYPWASASPETFFCKDFQSWLSASLYCCNPWVQGQGRRLVWSCQVVRDLPKGGQEGKEKRHRFLFLFKPPADLGWKVEKLRTRNLEVPWKAKKGVHTLYTYPDLFYIKKGFCCRLVP